MRATIITIVIVGLGLIAGIGCNEDNPTELAWINQNDLNETINEIIWADGNQIWSTTIGYSIGSTTESKEVSKLYGSVEVGLWDASQNEWVPCPVIEINGNAQSAITLNEGSSEVYTITKISDQR